MNLPPSNFDNWQANITFFRASVEDHWVTPPMRSVATYMAEEANEFMGRTHRDMRSGDLRSRPAEEKDDKRREAGTALVMLGTLANQLGVQLRPRPVDSKYLPVSEGGEGLDFLSLALQVNYVGAAIAVRVDRRDHNFDGQLIADLEHLFVLLLTAAHVMEFDLFEWMDSFLLSVEKKVAKERALEAAQKAG